ncbi:UNVERIFIED_CONTAM: hypothetical protein NCL1_43466 [Trichonephila clavipes]
MVELLMTLDVNKYSMVSMMVNTARRCNTGLTTPRHAEYQIINMILGNNTPLTSNALRSSGRQSIITKIPSIKGIQALVTVHLPPYDY